MEQLWAPSLNLGYCNYRLSTFQVFFFCKIIWKIYFNKKNVHKTYDYLTNIYIFAIFSTATIKIFPFFIIYSDIFSNFSYVFHSKMYCHRVWSIKDDYFICWVILSKVLFFIYHKTNTTKDTKKIKCCCI